MNLEQAVVYDIETLPNVFTLHMEALNSEQSSTWEISHFRDDRQQLFEWFHWLNTCQIPMIGFNSVGFDYPVIHALFLNPQMTVEQIYDKAMAIINAPFDQRFAHTVWASDRFTPQIDVFKIHHFDNQAKRTSLKALQINMRSQTVVDSPVQFGTNLTQEQIERDLIPYNIHDVKSTKAFAQHSMDAIKFRVSLINQFGPDALNFNDSKIGSKILEHRLGDHVCYDRSSGRKRPRQTPRRSIRLADIIFPYVSFQNPEFQRVLNYMRAQTLQPTDIENPESTISTKGVFSDLTATVGDLDFHFGTGGIHGSVKAQKFTASPEWLIRDIDVASLYPSIAIVNRLAPEHLGEAFIQQYAELPKERKKHKKGTVENAALKLAANGTYGNSNNKYSVFYDPRFTMTITINGQLMLCMLAEMLAVIPTIQLIQINTDGITYRIRHDYEPHAAAACKEWERLTALVLEDADYSRMWIRDVNNYVAETLLPDGSNEPAPLKQKGAYWYPNPRDYARSISTAGPPAWHKDFNPVAVTRAAVVAMVDGIPPETFLRFHTDPFDFMLRVKVPRGSKLILGDQEIQGTTRYYVAREGQEMAKVSPPKAGFQVGWFKKANGVSDADFHAWGKAWGYDTHNPDYHTKNKSQYETRRMGIKTGFKIAECNDVNDFDFANVDFDWYVNEARKLIIQ